MDSSNSALSLFLDDLDWMERHCQIMRKDGEIVPFRLNSTQLKIVGACLRQLESGRPVRIVGLKARQHGFSTLAQAMAFTRTARRRGVRSLLLSHQDDSKRKIWQMVGRFVRQAAMKPYVRHFGDVEGPLVWQHDSMMSCQTAGGKHVGHGETINFAHFSEVSRYGEGMSEDQQAQAKKAFYEIRAAVAKTPDSVVFIESTANGVGGLFYDEYWRARHGESDYEAVFIPWFEHEEYRLDPAQAGLRSVEDLDERERRLMDQHGLTLEQMAWRRSTIANDFGGDERLFREQFPATDTEAFLVSGSPVYDLERLDLYSAACRPPVWRGDVLFEPDAGWILNERADGPLKIWEWPRDDDSYAVGADSAECLDTRSDRDAAVVRSARSRDVVATLAGHWELGEYARKLAAVGYLYRRALLAPEKNNTGHAVVMVLREIGYGNIYCYERIDKATRQTTQVYGFPTDQRSKHAMVEAERSLLRTGAAAYPDADLLHEMRTFVNQANGKMGATAGSRDDLVIASAISALVIEGIEPPNPADERSEEEVMEDVLNALARDEYGVLLT